MAEIEVKVLDIDVEAVRRKLLALGAARVKLGRETNTMLDFPDGRLHARGGYVRLRQFCGKVVWTFKERVGAGPFKESREHETQVDSFEEAAAILCALGLEVKRVDEKDRESYRLGDILYELDRWPTYPTYLEIEAPSRERVVEGLALLGYNLEQSTSKRFHEISREVYGRELPPNLKFEE